MNFCPQCGTAIDSSNWPCTCAKCATTHYRNPKSVAVAVVPVCDENENLIGILGVQRSASTGHGAGKWALPGGFVDWAEDMIEGAVRELREETGIVRRRQYCHMIETVASSDGACSLVFVLTPSISEEQAALAVPAENECMAVGVLKLGQPLAFPSHAAIVERILAQGGMQVVSP